MIVATTPLPLSLDEREESHLDWAHENQRKAYAAKYHHEVAPPHDRLS